MNINLNKKVFPKTETAVILSQLKKACNEGFVRIRHENNDSLMASYAGVEEKGISPKWNIKIYKFNREKNGHSMVCVDMLVLQHILNNDFASFVPPDLRLLRIDDAGWGFPLCGVMVGISDEQEVKTATVPVDYFRSDTDVNFQTKMYLSKYADLAFRLLEEFHASPETHRIEICTGYVNQPLREWLRKRGYDVRVVEIKGLLQDQLERIFKQYVFDLIGADIYYDPKDINKSEIPKRYFQCVKYGKKNCPELLKTGWNALEGADS
jgi:hypothetical protein